MHSKPTDVTVLLRTGFAKFTSKVFSHHSNTKGHRKVMADFACSAFYSTTVHFFLKTILYEFGMGLLKENNNSTVIPKQTAHKDVR